jgi:Leucine-rich repeat (LRR) protein
MGNVTSLPRELWQLPSLEELVVESNIIPSLPAEVEELRAIKSIEIYLNLVWSEALDQSNFQKIDRLKNLKSFIIDVNFYPLTHFPVSIGALTNLLDLRFSACGLVNFENMSTSVGGLSECLKKLTIEHCRSLEGIPPEIWSLSNLEELNFQHNLFSTIPNEIGCLSNLQVLKLTCCGTIRSLPTGIGQLNNLVRIQISDCGGFRTIPPEIGRLKNLETLDIHNCGNLTALPDEIGSLTKLQDLMLFRVGLRSIPATIGSLQNLSHLKIDNCVSLESLPSEILNLLAIERLDLSSVSEEARIEDFFVPGCNLQKSLVNVVLSCNKLGEKDRLSNIWRFLSGCAKLECVCLTGNAIKDLTPFISALQGREDNRTASRLRILDVQNLFSFEEDFEEDFDEYPEVLVALLNTHLQLTYISYLTVHSGDFTPQVLYLMDLNRCGRILLEGRGITSIPLSVWPRILERTKNCCDREVERNASALYYFLRNGPALAARDGN